MSVDALLQRIDILEVLKKVGARTRLAENWDDEVQVWCPFCDDLTSKKPAGRANPLKGLYFCYACGFGDNIIGIAEQHLKDNEIPDPFWGSYVGRDTAIDWLEENWPTAEAEDDPWSS